jgi:hypothetical protein
MEFRSAYCVVCRKPFFDQDDVICYRLHRDGPVLVSLNGREPWSGVYSICRTCVAFFEGWKFALTNRLPEENG